MSARVCTAAAALSLLVVAGCGGSTATQDQPQPPATSPPASSAATTSFRVYFLHNEKVASAHRDAPVSSNATTSAAMQALLAGPTATELSAGLSTTIPTGTALRSVTVHSGTADADLDATYESGGGSLSMTARLMQVVFTLTQFPTVNAVTFRVDGKRVTTFGGEGVMLNHPMTRTDFASFLPPIFIDSPAMGESVSSPVRVTGLANVFEGQFLIEVIGPDGKVLARAPAHAAMGMHARFATMLRFNLSQAGSGRIVGFDYSPKDNSRIDDYAVPVSLTP